MQTIQIPLSNLTASQLNPRTTVTDHFLSQLKTSIQSYGMTTPLAVRKNGSPDQYIVIDGNTRLTALTELDYSHADCVVNDNEDINDVEFALITNQLRQPIDPWDECSAYFNLIVTDGKNIPDVANAFGVSDIHVKQRLALADLDLFFRESWSQNKITADALEYVTTLNKETQQAFAKHYQSQEFEYVINKSEVQFFSRRHTYSADDIIFPDHAGVVSQNLFGDREEYVQDNALFKERQLNQIEKMHMDLSDAFQGVFVDHIKTTDGLWQATDDFQNDYEMLGYDTLTAIDPLPRGLLFDNPSDFPFVDEREPDCILIISDEKMRVRVCYGKNKISTEHTSDIVTRQYSGVLLNVAREYVKLGCAIVFQKNPGFARSYLQSVAMHGGRAGVFNDMDGNPDETITARLEQVNNWLVDYSYESEGQFISLLAARFVAVTAWDQTYQWICSSDARLSIMVSSQPTEYLLNKMKRPMLTAIWNEIYSEGSSSIESDVPPLTKKELVSGLAYHCLETEWLLPLEELK